MLKNNKIIIVGAGIVGLCVAHRLLLKNPAVSIIVLDKESQTGKHASGRNSGVMHCGIFYGADTLKAKVCAQGSAQIGEFAREHGIQYQIRGKLILATRESDITSVERLLKNAADNSIRAYAVSPEEARIIEPFSAPAVGAIYCPDTATIDSQAVLNKLQMILSAKGVKFIFDCTVEGVGSAPNTLKTSLGNFNYDYLFNCAGAYADTVAKAFGLARNYLLIPFKGVYWKLSETANLKVKGNIYPVPDPELPFLGVHLSRVINGDVYLGPTAIPALGRENYHGFEGVDLIESLEILYVLGQMYLRNLQNFRLMTHHELLKYIKHHFFVSAQRLLPSLTIDDMLPSPKVGIRPQLVNTKNMKLEMDYIFEETENSLHVLNTISPAFTSSFAMADMIIEKSRINN